MHIRTFAAPTLQDALVEIRQQMGPDATVLHTKEVRSGWRGRLGRVTVEVTAGLKSNETPTPVDTRSATTEAMLAAFQAQANQQIMAFGAKVDSLSETLRSVTTQPAPTPSQPQADTTLRDSLLAAGFGYENARWLSDQVSEEIRAGQGDQNLELARILRSQIRTAAPIEIADGRQTIVAVVGPTGAGKTTTIAKLAAGFRLSEQRRVGLITIDTFRMAAVDQLQKYAEVMKLPMEVVSSLQQMPAAIDELADCDLVLIDTIGQSPRDADSITMTNQFIEAANPNEVLLTIPAVSSERTIDEIAKRFSALQPTASILSKLDEVEEAPAILQFARDAVPPVSYVTTGQRVPDDIDIAQPSLLTSVILAGVLKTQPRKTTLLDNGYPTTPLQNTDTTLLAHHE